MQLNLDGILDRAANTDTAKTLPVGNFIIEVDDVWERISKKDSAKYVRLTGTVVGGDTNDEMPKGTKAKVSFTLGASNGGDSKKEQLLSSFIVGNFYAKAMAKIGDPVKCESELTSFLEKLKEKEPKTLKAVEKMCENILPSEGTSSARGIKVKVVCTEKVSKAGYAYIKQTFYPYLGE